MEKKTVSAIMLTLLLTSMLTLAFNIQPVKAEPRTWYVDDSGGADFTKIQDAIYAASPGDTIYVYNGTYYESLLVFEDNLTIVGESKSNTILDGGGRVVIGVYSSRVVLSAFTVRNGGQSWYYVSGSAIILYSTRLCNISDNLVSDSRYGIVAFYGGKHIISSNTIRNTNRGIALYYSNNNTVFGNAVSEGVQVGSDPPYGIHAYGGGSIFNLIKGNIVSNNSIGVEIWDSNNNAVVDNSISTSTDRGISLETSYNNKIIGNTLSDNNYGINVGTSHDNEVNDNTVANCTNEGIMMGRSFSNTVTNNTITESNIAVYLGDSHSNNISENKATSNVWGLWLVDSKDNEANHNRIINNSGGILVLGANSSGNTIRGNIIKNSTNVQSAIFLHTCNNNTICHNNFVENALPQILNYASLNIWDDGYPSGGNYWSDYVGVDADDDGIGDTPYVIDADNQDRYPLMHPWSPLPVHNINTGLGYATIQGAIDAPETLDGHTVFVGLGTYYEIVFLYKSLTLIGENEYNTIIDGSGVGRVIYVTSDNVEVSGFTLQHGNEGIHLDYSCNNIITYNIVNSNTWAGIVLYAHSDNCTIQGNIVSFNEEGIILESSNDNTINANQVVENVDGIRLDYSTDNLVSHNNATSNVYRGILLDHSENSNVKKNVVTLNSIGIMLHASEHNVIEDNKVTHNGEGILLASSNRNIVEANEAVENGGNGIRLYNSSYNEVSHNNASIDDTGIVLETSSNNNTLFGNNAASNYNGILVGYYSDNNAIYHNNFLHNTVQVVHITSGCVNVWDNGYLSGGNFWSDYVGVDVESGLNQDLPGSDCIGDTPYIIDANNRDCYPLMNLYGAPPLPTYTLAITTTVGGTTDSAPGTYSYTANSTVQVTAIPEASYLFDYSELDGVNVGSANPYSVLMDKNHTLKAVFSLLPPPLQVSISPLSASILVSQSVTFTSTISGGYTPYTYQWYLNGAPVSGATSDTWALTPATSGIYYAYLKVTDSKANTAQSDAARIAVATVPVGGYSFPIQVSTKAEPIIPYIALVAALTAVFTKLRPKTKRKR